MRLVSIMRHPLLAIIAPLPYFSVVNLIWPSRTTSSILHAPPPRISAARNASFPLHPQNPLPLRKQPTCLMERENEIDLAEGDWGRVQSSLRRAQRNS
eukprot:1232688-Rhodomonas_salina.2